MYGATTHVYVAKEWKKKQWKEDLDCTSSTSGANG